MRGHNEEQRQRGKFIDKLLQRFKVGEGGRAKVQQILNHPANWLKGRDLPYEQLAPWEKLLFGLHNFLHITSTGFSDGRDRLYRYTFRVNPNHITISNVTTSIWDAITDPIIGQYMDRRPMNDNTYRWIVRINHAISVFINMFYLLDLGFSPVQRMVMFTSVQLIRDVLSTMSEVSYTKYFAGITPSSIERGKTMVWANVGMQIAWPFANIPLYIMGFARDRATWNDYRIYTRGYAIVLPVALASGIIRTFAKNRVQFDGAVNSIETQERAEESGEKAEKMSIKESFMVLRHNKYLLYTSLATFLTMLSPHSDNYPIYRFMFPTLNVFGRPMTGEAIIPLSKQFSGLPITFLYPFLAKLVHVAGGPKKTLILAAIMKVFANTGKYFIGFNGWGPIVMLTLMDTIIETVVPMESLADHVLNYEMLDYVEYKTGVRSEGITMSFRAMIQKFITNNVNSFTYNYFQSWTGINRVDMNAPGAVLPERFSKYAWAVFTLSLAFDAFIQLFARIAFPYQYGQNKFIEAELKERRELAEKTMNGLEEKV